MDSAKFPAILCTLWEGQHSTDHSWTYNHTPEILCQATLSLTCSILLLHGRVTHPHQKPYSSHNLSGPFIRASERFWLPLHSSNEVECRKRTTNPPLATAQMARSLQPPFSCSRDSRTLTTGLDRPTTKPSWDLSSPLPPKRRTSSPLPLQGFSILPSDGYVTHSYQETSVSFSSRDPSPQPMRNFAIFLVAEGPVTKPYDAKRSLHSRRDHKIWPWNTEWGFFFQDTDNRKTLIHLCCLPAESTEPLQLFQLDLQPSSCQALSSSRRDSLFLSPSFASQSSPVSSSVDPSMKHLRDLGCCREKS